MSYAAELIAEVRKARSLTTDKAVADALGIDPSTLNQWKHGKGSPMPPERVIELCKLAGIAEEAQRGYWLTGIERDAVTITSVRRALDGALDKLRPVAAAVGLLALCAMLASGNDALSMAYIAALPVNVYYVLLLVTAGVILAAARRRKTWTAFKASWAVPHGAPDYVH